MHYTEPGIRVITVFFAALVGFGLNRLADVTGSNGPDSHPDDFTCFVLAVLLFLRFLLGSANHLWHEHSRPQGKADTLRLGIDLLFLIFYGLIAVYTCYAKTLEQFLWSSVVLLGVACVWSGLEKACDSHENRWEDWFIINIAQISCLLLVVLGMIDVGDLWFGYALWKVFLLLVYSLCLVADFCVQMRVLENRERVGRTIFFFFAGAAHDIAESGRRGGVERP